MKPEATWIAELDRIRLELPGPGFRMTFALTPEQAMDLAVALKRALGMRKLKTGEKL